MASLMQLTWANSGRLRGLACCSPWGHKELDTTGQLNTIIFSKSIYVAANGNISFFLVAEQYSISYTYMYIHEKRWAGRSTSWNQDFWEKYQYPQICRTVQFCHSVVSNSLQPHESQQARPPCPSPTPGVHSDSRPSSS